MKFSVFVILLVSCLSLSAAPPIFDKFDAFFQGAVENGRVRYEHIDQQELLEILSELKTIELSNLDEDEKKALMINAYNVFVIAAVVDAGIPESVQDVPNFFDKKAHLFAGATVSLNELEKDMLFKQFPDPRLHFAVVCGAIGCPPIIDHAYYPESLDRQLEEQTVMAVNNSFFVEPMEDQVKLSQIFQWYATDFGSSREERIAWINRYRSTTIDQSLRISYSEYNWELNKAADPKIDSLDSTLTPKNGIRYVVSSTIPKGSTETKIFNNLYTQSAGDGTVLQQRSNYFTSIISSLYGVSNTFNAGIEIRYRRTSSQGYPSSPFDIFNDVSRMGSRHALATIGPKIRWAPVPKWGNFSIQSALWIPLRNDLEGTDELAYVDWNRMTSFTQIFNDFSIGSSFSLFAEVDLLLEDIGRNEQDLNRFSTPVTMIASYFPEPKTTIYLLNGFSPIWTPDLDYFYQGGVGAKYQFSRKFEIEALYTLFTNSFLQEINGRAATINFGVRINT